MSATQEQITALEKRVGPAGTSPLFARLASIYLDAGRANDALRLCDKGIAQHPFYTTGHLVKGKALLALQMRAEARREFEFVLDMLPGNEWVRKLLESIPSPPEESLVAEAPVKEAPTPEPHPEPVIARPAPKKPETTDPFGGIMGFTPSATPEAQEEEAPPPAPPEPQVFQGFGVPAETTDDPFGLTGFTAPDAPPAEAPAAPEMTPEPELGAAPEPETTTASGFDLPAAETPVFGGIPTPEPPPAVEEPPQVESMEGAELFMGPGEGTTAAPTGEGTFEQFAERMRLQLDGENTMSFEEYFGGTAEPSAAPPAVNSIEEIAEKLQTAKKITPVINLAEKSAAPASEQDTAASMGFVTPTLAEIYAKQGWYDDAIKAYRTLAVNKPAERERFEKRIAELEEEKKHQSPGT